MQNYYAKLQEHSFSFIIKLFHDVFIKKKKILVILIIFRDKCSHAPKCHFSFPSKAVHFIPIKLTMMIHQSEWHLFYFELYYALICPQSSLYLRYTRPLIRQPFLWFPEVTSTLSLSSLVFSTFHLCLFFDLGAVWPLVPFGFEHSSASSVLASLNSWCPSIFSISFGSRTSFPPPPSGISPTIILGQIVPDLLC